MEFSGIAAILKFPIDLDEITEQQTEYDNFSQLDEKELSEIQEEGFI